MLKSFLIYYIGIGEGTDSEEEGKTVCLIYSGTQLIQMNNFRFRLCDQR